MSVYYILKEIVVPICPFRVAIPCQDFSVQKGTPTSPSSISNRELIYNLENLTLEGSTTFP